MDAYKLHRHFLCIDLKSFYASVECALLDLDPFATPLVVADLSRGKGSIVLAVSPYLRMKGMPGRCRIHELPTDLGIRFQKPRMKTYLEYATRIIEIYLRFVSEEDIHVYSIDEVFLDVTSYLGYYGKTDIELAKDILATVLRETKIHATCGIGPNMLISKLALDLESKTSPDFIAKWDYDDIPTKLWPVTPLSEMWGIGPRMERNLNALGLFRVGDIARYDVRVLKRKFGIMGAELYHHAHGIDMSLIQDRHNVKSAGKSYGIGQTLFHDYYPPDIYQLIMEMADDVSSRLRRSGRMSRTVSFAIAYSKETGGGFARQRTLDRPSANASVIYEACRTLFLEHYDGRPIRRVHVGAGNLVSKGPYQYSLFDDNEMLLKEQDLFETVDRIHGTYGKNSVIRASSTQKSSTLRARNARIGGHNA